MPPGTPLPEAMRSTLLCFVLVGPGQKHAFCSRYDFGPWPLLEGVTALPERVTAVCTACCNSSTQAGSDSCSCGVPHVHRFLLVPIADHSEQDVVVADIGV